MKALFLAFALILIAGCSKNDSNTNNGFGGPGPQGGEESQPQGKGFTAHPWCYAYNSDQGPVQDRFMFANGGALSYDEFDFQNNSRGVNLGSAKGTWGLQGSVLTMQINGASLVFQVQYVYPDPVTGGERLHAYMNGDDAIYEPCL